MRVFLCLSLVLALAFAEEWGSDSVKFVSDEDWEEFRGKNPKFLTMFYAPWCGHCKAMKPAFGEAAAELQFRVPLVAVDCTEGGKETCGKYDVKGFPSLKWFGSSDGDAEDYNGGRSTADFVKFIDEKVGDEPENYDGVDFNTYKVKQLKKILFDRGQTCKGCSEKKDFVKKVEASIHLPKSGPPKKKSKKFAGSSLVNGRTVAQERRWKESKKVADEGWGEDNGDVVHLIEDDFDTYLKEKGAMFTMFYAPWCGHCKSFKPHMAEASTEVKDIVPVTAVDCTTNGELCRKHKATSYPTLVFFPSDAATESISYTGGRTGPALAKWLKKKMDPSLADVVEPFENVPVWEENGEVIHMTGEHWDTYRKENPQALVLFYAPWCGHCKAIKPDWATASTKTKLPFLAVDCTEHTDLCGKFNVKGYPTIKYFDSSDDGKVEDFNSGRDLDSLVSFAESKVEAVEATEEPVKEEL